MQQARAHKPIRQGDNEQLRRQERYTVFLGGGGGGGSLLLLLLGRSQKKRKEKPQETRERKHSTFKNQIINYYT